MEKQRDKIAKRAQRKLTAGQEPLESEAMAPEDLGLGPDDLMPAASEPSEPSSHEMAAIGKEQNGIQHDRLP
jgi:hypothetical protein